MDPVVLAAGTALVTAMATDTWQQVREGVVALWRRVHPGQAIAVEADLTQLHEQILAALRNGDDDAERAPADSWQTRPRLLRRTTGVPLSQPGPLPRPAR